MKSLVLSLGGNTSRCRWINDTRVQIQEDDEKKRRLSPHNKHAGNAQVRSAVAEHASDEQLTPFDHFPEGLISGAAGNGNHGRRARLGR